MLVLQYWLTRTHVHRRHSGLRKAGAGSGNTFNFCNCKGKKIRWWTTEYMKYFVVVRKRLARSELGASFWSGCWRVPDSSIKARSSKGDVMRLFPSASPRYTLGQGETSSWLPDHDRGVAGNIRTRGFLYFFLFFSTGGVVQPNKWKRYYSS